MIQSVSNSLPQFNVRGAAICLVEYGLVYATINFLANRIFGADISLPMLLLAALYITVELNDIVMKTGQKVLTAQKRNEWQ